MKHFLILALVLVVIVCMLTGCKGKENPTDMMQDAMTTISEGLGDMGKNTTAPTTQSTTHATEGRTDTTGENSSDSIEGSTGESESNARARRGMNRR